MTDELPHNRGVKKGDPLSPKLFTAVIENVFRKTGISEGINVDGENLTNVRFANDVARFNEKKTNPHTHTHKKPTNNGKKTFKQSELRKS